MSRWPTLALVLGLISPFVKASAADWPKGLVLHEESSSPDGHYGIIVATSPRVKDGTTFLIPEDGEEFVNYLASWLQVEKSRWVRLAVIIPNRSRMLKRHHPLKVESVRAPRRSAPGG